MKKKLGIFLVLGMGFTSLSAQAAVENGWEEIDGKYYWYEAGVLQGYDANNPAYRGKEIYDPATEAWYWLDSVQGGAKTVDKDVYQESLAGDWGENVGIDGAHYGKWVRYDENGNMVKGWNTNEKGVYYFDPIYGTMAKGTVNIDGQECYFDENTGIGADCVWIELDGISYWYEEGVRQGYRPEASFRGKEIYDPASDAWYWLDNVQAGAKTVGKDVYQDTPAGEWGEYIGEDGEYYGKWVRYDENGCMVKGWNTNEQGTYYFHPLYGTMAKGMVEIDGVSYLFDEITGTLVTGSDKLAWYLTKEVKYNANNTVISQLVYEYDAKGNCTKYARYEGRLERLIYNELNEYDEQGNMIRQTVQNFITEGGYRLSNVLVYEYEKGRVCSKAESTYNAYGEIASEVVTRYLVNGEIETVSYYNGERKLTKRYSYEYDEQGYLIRVFCDNLSNVQGNMTMYYENDSQGRVLKMSEYDYQGVLTYTTVYTYDSNSGKVQSYETRDEVNGWSTERREYDYDQNGNVLENRYFYRMAIQADESDYTYIYELKLRSKNGYRYDEMGNRIQADAYTYDSMGVERHISCNVYTYENYDEQGALVKTYDSYYEHSAVDENGYFIYDENGKVTYELGYNLGYENNRDGEGILVKQIFYVGNVGNRYTKTLDYWVEYGQTILPEPETQREIYEKNPHGIAYFADGSVKYYTVQEYTAYGNKE